MSRIKTWRLKQSSVQKALRVKARNVLTEDLEWDEINSRVAKIVKEICGVSKSTCRKETWWWNDDAVKKALKEKKEKYKKWRNERSEEARSEYVKCRNKAKREVAKAMHEEARKEAQRIEEMKVEERMRHVYRLAKAKALCKRDVVGCPCMRS